MKTMWSDSVKRVESIFGFLADILLKVQSFVSVWDESLQSFFFFLNFWISILLQHFGSVSGFKIGDPILKSVKRFSCNWVFIFFMKRLLYFCTNQTILKHQFYSATFTLKISITPNGLGKLFWQKWHHFLLTFQNNSVPDDLTRLKMKFYFSNK